MVIVRNLLRVLALDTEISTRYIISRLSVSWDMRGNLGGILSIIPLLVFGRLGTSALGHGMIFWMLRIVLFRNKMDLATPHTAGRLK